ncbi:hypothetical protein RHMOL_Rhmol11G0222700 [Rhododendron molle]|uniref:Uncharacterized protein n=1 Tax=Rhododendron molle TaxID=49168 RepID=A0ACC0LW37_RHOML|nr:hypothetical protein RHMOL_Rhmol11G0222700 [Rhododendron molle]
MDQEICHLELRVLPVRVALKKALSPLLKVSTTFATAICKPDGISLQAFPGEQNDEFPLLSAVLRIDPASVDYFRCSPSITANFELGVLDFILSFAPDEGNINVTANYVDDEVNFASGDSGEDFFGTRYLSCVSNEHPREIDDSVFEYAVVVGIASEDFRRVIWHFRDLSPFVEAFVTDEDVTFRFGPEEIVLKPEDGNCVIGGINGYHRVQVRLSLHNPDSLLEALELSTSVWMLKPRDWPDLLSCPVRRLADEGITVTADYQRMEVAFSLGRFVGKTTSLGTDIPNNIMEIDDSEFVYAVVVGIASEDFRRIIRHFRHLSPFVEAFATDEEVTFIFGPEEIVLKTENGNCVIGGTNGYHRVKIRLSLLNPDSLLEASELSSSV